MYRSSERSMKPMRIRRLSAEMIGKPLTSVLERTFSVEVADSVKTMTKQAIRGGLTEILDRQA